MRTAYELRYKIRQEKFWIRKNIISINEELCQLNINFVDIEILLHSLQVHKNMLYYYQFYLRSLSG